MVLKTIRGEAAEDGELRSRNYDQTWLLCHFQWSSFVPSSTPDGSFSGSLPFRPQRVSWVKVDDDMPSHAVVIGADLYIENLNKSYNGTYRCTASNSVGESFDDYVLYVYGTSVTQTPNGRALVWVLQQGAAGSGFLCTSSASFTLDLHVSGSCNTDIFTGGMFFVVRGRVRGRGNAAVLLLLAVLTRNTPDPGCSRSSNLLCL